MDWEGREDDTIEGENAERFASSGKANVRASFIFEFS